MMKKITLILLFTSIIFANSTQKIYFYTTDTNINNFKSLKISFDSYLSQFGDYEFQPFNNKKTFEKYLKQKDSIVIISSWHYRKIAKEYNLQAKLVAQKKGTITDTKMLVGQKNTQLKGVVTSAYDKEYTKELLSNLTNSKSKQLSVLVVPKEIDALMSVGFGMSKFAVVSKDSFQLLKQINPPLADSLEVYNESTPKYRMLLAHNKIDVNRNKLISIFKDMQLNNNGKRVLNIIGVDKLIILPSKDLTNLEEAK